MSVLQSTLAAALAWREAGRRVALATVFEAEGSSPFETGATMAIDAEGKIEGSVTGGCVEGAVAQAAIKMLAGGERTENLRYGISDDLAGSVGLTCGGTVHVGVRELDAGGAEVLAAVLAAARVGDAVAVATVLDGAGAGESLAVTAAGAVGSLGTAAGLEPHLIREVEGMLTQGTSGLRRYGADGGRLGNEVRVFIDSHSPPARIVIFGAVDFAAALAPPAAALGFAVTICDARSAFTGSSRFSEAARVVVGWPEELLADERLGPRDAILVFTHDPKFDEPALLGALRTGVGYIGALGSRRTVADRNRRLLAAGATEAELARICSPAGLDIGARDPEETALSILAEIIAVRNGRGGGQLREARGPIHPS